MIKLIKLSIFLCVMGICCVLAGCSKAQKRQIVDEQGNKIISFYTMQLKTDFSDFINGMISEFEQNNPKVKIKWIDQPADGFETKLMSMYSVGESPDVINLNTGMMLNLHDRNLLLNLNDYLTTKQRSMFVKSMIDEACTFNGNTAGLPWYISPAVTMINTEVFKKAGLDPTHAPMTLDELMDYCRIIREKTGLFGVMLPLAENGVFRTMILNEGIPLTNPEKTQAIFANERSAEVLRKYKNAYDKEWIPRESVTGKHRRAIDMFKNGKAAMLVNGPQFLRTIKTEAPDIYTSCSIGFTAPRLPNYTYGTETQAVCISAKTAHPKEALAFALWLCAPKNQLQFSHLVPVFPSTTEALADPYFADKGTTPEQMAIYIGAQEVAKGVPNVPTLPLDGKLCRAIDDMVRQVFLRNVPPEKALEQAQERWNRILASHKQKETGK
ncbi:sugar ABC transporter substrate-binding protein [Candidatus Sumerlaeota bacterium]|nr:sugar ABC transporter substrate-binding protein [Candidatus Sumerlaeota bacterium]